MGRREVLADRRAMEEFYYNCKLETPEEVAKLFEVLTKLIWNHHQAGLVYDYYCDETVINREGGGKMIGGIDTAEIHTIPSFAPYPSKTTHFVDIFCVGNKEDGYRFGQVTDRTGVFAKGGACKYGLGNGQKMHRGEQVNFCQCYVKKVNGRWIVVDEYLEYGEEVNRQREQQALPFYKTVLDQKLEMEQSADPEADAADAAEEGAEE